MAFVWNDGQVLFRLRADEGLLLPAGTVSSWSDWVYLWFVYTASTATLQIFVNAELAGSRVLTLAADASLFVGAPLRFGGNHSDPDSQNLNAQIAGLTIQGVSETSTLACSLVEPPFPWSPPEFDYPELIRRPDL